MQGDHAAAFTFHERSLKLHRRLGNPMSIAYALSNLGNIAAEVGDFERARTCHQEAAELHRLLGNEAEQAGASIHLAEILDRQGHESEARELFERTLSTMDDLAERTAPGGRAFVRWLLAYGMSLHASTALRREDLALARQLALRALFIYRDVGDAREGARILALLAEIAHAQGDTSAAIELLLEALTTRHATRDRPGLADALERLATVAQPLDPDRACRLLGAADLLREQMGTPVPTRERPRREQLLATLRSILGPDQFRAAFDAGRRRTLTDAVADASALATEAAIRPR
jgi:tetratricopeptide (TPR) repeat protein